MKLFKVKYEPKQYQKDAVTFALSRSNSIICGETGCGKTYMCILQALICLSQKKVTKVLQIVTKKSKLSFEADYMKLTDIDINNQIRVIYTREDLLDFIETPELIIGVAQYELFKNISVADWQSLFRTHKTLVQLDEYHKAKTAMTELYIPKNGVTLEEKQVKSFTNLNSHLYSLRPDIAYFTGYTATPLTRNLDDLFWLATLAEPGIFKDSLLDFYNTYIVYNAYLIPIKSGSFLKRTNIVKYGYKNLDLLKSKLNNLVFNYFEPKNIKFHVRYYDPSECFQEYRQAVQGVLDTYNERKINDEGEAETKNFSSRLTDAQYVLNNCYAKKECLLHTLKEAVPNGTLIYGNYYNTVGVIEYVLMNAFIPNKEISGRTTESQCKKVMKWFNDSPENKAVVLTSAGSQSINLQSTNNFIFYDLPYTIGQWLQAIGRIIRLGSKYDEFNIYFILAKDTLDEYKFNYIGSNNETVRYIQGNPNLFDSEIKNPNTELLKQLRKKTLWDKAS